MKKIYLIIIAILLISICIFSNNNNYTTKTVRANGGLLVSIDGVQSDSLPTSGNYVLSKYKCNNKNTRVFWDNENYELRVTNNGKKGSIACSLTFNSKE